METKITLFTVRAWPGRVKRTAVGVSEEAARATFSARWPWLAPDSVRQDGAAFLDGESGEIRIEPRLAPYDGENTVVGDFDVLRAAVMAAHQEAYERWSNVVAVRDEEAAARAEYHRNAPRDKWCNIAEDDE